jgi:dTDP-4-dehydrorhamnose 3,5-epimerase
VPNVEKLSDIAGVLRVELQARGDHRGRLLETYRQEWLDGPRGVPQRPMVQGIRSDSKRGVVRALHYHLEQADYWYVPVGSLVCGLYDLRRSSPTQGTRLCVELGEAAEFGLYIPPGVAHGFQATSDVTLTYLVDRPYDASDEYGLAWDDPDAAIPWPLPDLAVVSERDRTNPKLGDIPADRLPP